MEPIWLIVGVALGAAVCFFYMKWKATSEADSTVVNHPMVHQLRIQLEDKSNECLTERKAREQLIGELASARQKISSLEEKIAAGTQELNEVREQMNREFQNLANAIMDKTSEKFSKQNKEQIDTILTPLRERIKDFEQKVEKTYDVEKGERIRLKKEIEDLVNLNKKLSEDAENLTTALRGDNKAQGNWGELILEKILERSGLKEEQEYTLQYSTVNADGTRIRPDVVIFLPENKHLVIDSKVSLLAYSNFVGATDETSRAAFLKQHVDSVRNHIKLLGDKNYQTAEGLRTPDFIMLFMPMEAAFSAALQNDGELFSYAWERKIVLVSPTTLLATLRTVDSIWRQEKRSKHADSISEEAGKLYDKFVGFTADLLDVGRKMNSAKESYDMAMNKLTDGTGNIVKRLEKMRAFAAKTGSKSVNEKLIERAAHGENDEA